MGLVFTSIILRRLLAQSAAATSRPQRPTESAAARGWSLAARWLLLAAVIGGVLAMHILSGADMGGNHRPMAMTSASGSSPAGPPSMLMDMSAAQIQAPATHAVAGTQLAADGMGMSAMSCCVLFVVTAMGVALLMRFCGVCTAPAAGGRYGVARSALQRGPPGTGRPRIALRVLRV